MDIDDDDETGQMNSILADLRTETSADPQGKPESYLSNHLYTTQGTSF